MISHAQVGSCGPVRPFDFVIAFSALVLLVFDGVGVVQPTVRTWAKELTYLS